MKRHQELHKIYLTIKYHQFRHTNDVQYDKDNEDAHMAAKEIEIKSNEKVGMKQEIIINRREISCIKNVLYETYDFITTSSCLYEIRLCK